MPLPKVMSFALKAHTLDMIACLFIPPKDHYTLRGIKNICNLRHMSVYLKSKDRKMTFSAKAIFEIEDLNTSLDFIELSRKGVSMKILNKIQAFTSLTSKEIAQILPVSERQLVRYSIDHMLRKDISSHLIQIVEFFDKGYDIFGEAKFQKWIRSEIIALNDMRPIDFMDTPIGINMLEDILGRIEHGVYS